jgi:hypothetical protein
MTTTQTAVTAAGDPIPANCELIEVRVSELKQLFNAIDRRSPAEISSAASSAITSLTFSKKVF